MRGSNRMEVSRKMQIDLLHRKHLCISPTRCSSLHAEARTERRLAQSDNRLLSDFVQSQDETDRYCSFADTRLCRCDGSYQDKVTFLHFLLIDQLFGNLRDVATIIFDFFTRDSDAFGNLLDLFQLDTASYFYV